MELCQQEEENSERCRLRVFPFAKKDEMKEVIDFEGNPQGGVDRQEHKTDTQQPSRRAVKGERNTTNITMSAKKYKLF